MFLKSFINTLFIFSIMSFSASAYAVESDCPGAEPSEILKEAEVGNNILPIKDLAACLDTLTNLTNFQGIPGSIKDAIGKAIEQAAQAGINAACGAVNQQTGQYVSIGNSLITTAISTAQNAAAGAATGLISGATGSNAVTAVVGSSIANSIGGAIGSYNPPLSGGVAGIAPGTPVTVPQGTVTAPSSWVW